MARRYDTEELAACGSVTAEELEPRVGDGATVRRILYVWRSTARLETQLPEDFELRVLSAVTADGARRFTCADSDSTYIAGGFAAGVALLDRLRGFTREQRLKYRAPSFIYQYVQETHAHLDCNFLSRPQFVLKGRSGSDDRELNVLPTDFGFNSAGRGPRWTIDRLWEEGNTAARTALGRRPTPQEIITYGLWAAARRNPLRRNSAEVRGDVRRALFDTDAIIAAPSRRLITIVKDRLYRLLDAHLDDSTDDFNRWFFPAGGRNLPRAIARQPHRPGGVLSKEDVTGALLHLAWDAYGLIGECLGVLGQAFLAALSEPLSPRERRWFDVSMMPHRHFGGLPRWLLMERVEFLKPALQALLINPRDQSAVGALHRLLAWYPEMVRKRREVDRLNKRRSGNRGRQISGGQTVIDQDLTEERRLENRYRRRRRNSNRRQEE